MTALYSQSLLEITICTITKVPLVTEPCEGFWKVIELPIGKIV